MGSGCGSVGRAASSDTRDPRFESRHGQNFICQMYNRKDKNKEKEAWNGPLKNKNKKQGSSNLLIILQKDFDSQGNLNCLLKNKKLPNFFFLRVASPSFDIGFGNGLDEVSLEDKFYFFDLWFERVPLKQQPRLERMLLLRRWSAFYSKGKGRIGNSYFSLG